MLAQELDDPVSELNDPVLELDDPVSQIIVILIQMLI